MIESRVSDEKQPGEYVFNDADAGREVHVPPQSLVPDRATSMPPAGPGSTRDERAELALQRLSECGPDDEGPALESLLTLGDAGLAAVESTFPGLLWFHRSLAHTSVPAGRDCGPSCRVINAFGNDAIPTLQRLLVGHDDARYYAVLLAADRLDSTHAAGARVLVEALMARVLDGDSGVADAAVQALEARRDNSALNAQAAAYCVQLRNPSHTVEVRADLLRTLAVLRWPELVPACVELLSDADESLRRMALGGLRLMTAAPLSSKSNWLQWWKKRGTQKRTDWLIDGLGSRNISCRKTAYEELTRLYGETVSYDVAMSWLARRNAQKAFRKLAAAQ